MGDEPSRPTLRQLALRLRRRTALDPLPTRNLLLALRNIMQRLARDWLAHMLLCASSRPSLDWIVAARNFLFLFRNLGYRFAVEHPRGLDWASWSVAAVREGEQVLRERCWSVCDGAVFSGNAALAHSDLVDDLGRERLAGVGLRAGCGSALDGIVLVCESLLGGGDLRDEVRVDDWSGLSGRCHSCVERWGDGCAQRCQTDGAKEGI